MNCSAENFELDTEINTSITNEKVRETSWTFADIRGACEGPW